MKAAAHVFALLLACCWLATLLVDAGVGDNRHCTSDANCSSLAHRCAADGHCFMPMELGMECEEDIQCQYMEPRSECVDFWLHCECINGYHREGVTCKLDPTTTLPPTDTDIPDALLE